MRVSETAFYEIIQQTWSSTLGLPVEPVPAGEFDSADALTVGVDISGAWEGEVRLCCSASLGRSIAAVIFEVEAERADQNEILDALCELIHIVGGNLKALLPQPVTLSLPALVDGDPQVSTARPWDTVHELTLASRDQCFVVALLAKASVEAGSAGLKG